MTKKNVCHLVVEGKLLGFKVGGSWRFKELDIENWIEEQKQSNRGVAIFAKACFGHPSPSKRQKLNATSGQREPQLPSAHRTVRTGPYTAPHIRHTPF